VPTDPIQTESSPVGTESSGLAELEARLITHWDRLLPHQTDLGRSLLRRYAEPHRHYHDTRHLAAVLDRIEEFAEDHDLFLVRLAAWFHDAVYAIPPGQLSNEDASARLVRRELGRAGLEQEDINEVARLVRLTGTHRPGPHDPEGELICDADLAVLAGSEEAYAAYVTAVRAEYASVPDQAFVAGRLQVMTNLLNGNLFHTTKGFRLERAARANVEAECADLEARLEDFLAGS
jgi:predicted metal-dependent HD superfamily phosphohydrolase